MALVGAMYQDDIWFTFWWSTMARVEVEVFWDEVWRPARELKGLHSDLLALLQGTLQLEILPLILLVHVSFTTYIGYPVVFQIYYITIY